MLMCSTITVNYMTSAKFCLSNSTQLVSIISVIVQPIPFKYSSWKEGVLGKVVNRAVFYTIKLVLPVCNVLKVLANLMLLRCW